MVRPLTVGDMIHGHIGGWFGRDFYECARVEAIGYDWVVVRNDHGRSFATSVAPDRASVLRTELIESRDRFDRWFCDHEHPKEEDQ